MRESEGERGHGGGRRQAPWAFPLSSQASDQGGKAVRHRHTQTHIHRHTHTHAHTDTHKHRRSWVVPCTYALPPYPRAHSTAAFPGTKHGGSS
eukprot:557386-Rhodomonas_salina.2